MKKPVLAFVLGIFLFFFSLILVSRFFLPKTRPVISIRESLIFENSVSPTPTPSQICVNLLFGGDMMFDRHIREKAQARGNYDFILSDVGKLLSRADGIVANLEGPATDFPSRSVGSAVGSTDNYFFTFDPAVITTMLARWPFFFNLGNNHILNFGQEGLNQTYRNIDQSALSYFGYVQPNQASPSYLIHKFNGINVGLINYNQFVIGGRERAFKDLATVRPLVEVVVVYAHWGNEYSQENQVIKDLAHEFVDAGADMVVGAHPHIVQGKETYQGKQIYYSLGNFVFDQYFEEAVQNGLLVKAEICQTSPKAKPNFSFTEYPIVLKNTGETLLLDSVPREGIEPT